MLPSLLLSIARIGQIVPLFFRGKEGPIGPDGETFSVAFGYLNEQLVLANRFGADALPRHGLETWFADGDGMLGTGFQNVLTLGVGR